MAWGDRVETRSELEAAEMEREGRISDRMAANTSELHPCEDCGEMIGGDPAEMVYCGSCLASKFRVLP